MRFRTRNHSVHTLTLDDGSEVELEFAPYYEDDIIVSRVGNALVVGYLVQDIDPAVNPLTDYDCQGDLYTKAPYSARDSAITDNDPEFYGALGLDSYGGINWASLITIDGGRDYIGNFAAARVLAELDNDQIHMQMCWLHRFGVVTLSDEQLNAADNMSAEDFNAWCDEARGERSILDDLEDENGYHSDLVQKEVERLYALHWQEIAGPYVVPVYANTGGYESVYRPTTWDGDLNDLPDGVWVADKGAIENIGEGCRKGVVVKRDSRGRRGEKGWVVFADDREVAFFPDNAGAAVNGQPEAYTLANAYVEQHYGDRPMDVHTAAVHYAACVLDEYSKWCSGEVFGCVVQVFDLKDTDAEEPEWVSREDHDSCWGFIGQEYALEALADDFVDPAVGRLQNELMSSVESEGGLTD